MLAAITFLSCLQLVGLVIVAVLLIAAFIYWVSYGGFLGWWIANDMMKALGVVVSAIVEVVGGMLRSD